MSEQSRAAEQAYLDRTIDYVKAQIEGANVDMGKVRTDIYAQRRYVWDNYYRLKPDEIILEETEMGRQMHRFGITKTEAERLSALIDRPFFARLDFTAQGEATEALYIGPGSILDRDTFECYVHDWRAPVSSLYYDYECGPASYVCPDGVIAGEISLKRQFEIENRRIVAQFDTAVAIRDALLQSILGKGASPRMHDIVSTIQREQNKVIRDGSRLLLVSGVAGSGKTSIALHRIAYLLYQQRDTLKADQVVIFSPNEIFSDYISQVLPSLGESNVWQTSFSQLANRQLLPRAQKQSMADWLEDVLDGGPEADMLEEAREKMSDEFARALIEHMDAVEAAFTFHRDMVFADCGTIISRDELNSIYRDGKDSLTMHYRMKRIETLYYTRMGEIKKQTIERWADDLEREEPHGPYLSREEAVEDARLRWQAETERADKELRRLLRLNPVRFYGHFLKDRLGIGAQSRFRFAEKRGHVLYEDVAPLLWIRCRMGQLLPATAMRHVVVDEAQDYGALHFMILRHLYPHADFTVLGDPMQRVNPADGHTSLDYVQAALGKPGSFVHLSQTYRLTEQICAYANRHGGDLHDAVMRQGPAVQEVSCEDMRECAAAVHTFFSGDGAGRLQAVVTPTLRRAVLLQRELIKLCDCTLLAGSEADEIDGIMVMPYYLAKGLEFDDVAVDATGSVQGRYEYICATRAMNRLLVLR